MFLSMFMLTGCDAEKIVQVIQQVAQGIQQAAPAIQQVIDTVTQTVNSIRNPGQQQPNNPEPANPAAPAEQNAGNGQAAVNIPAADDREDIADGTQTQAPAQVPASANLPAASGGSEAGSTFMTRTQNMSRAQKDQAIVQAITSGNMPDFLRNFRDVTVRRRLSDGQFHTITYKVMPDYLAIGTNDDFVRAPMTPGAAQQIADRFNCILPTTQMVDDIYQNAQTKVAPRPMPAGANMTSNDYFARHQTMVEEQARSAGHANGQLLAGHKKDVVISNRLDRNPGKVAIYGWHRTNGSPIQSLSTVHGENYVDYSHGIRLIQKTVVVDGREMSIEEVLRDPVLSGLLSNEGPIRNTNATR